MLKNKEVLLLLDTKVSDYSHNDDLELVYTEWARKIPRVLSPKEVEEAMFILSIPELNKITPDIIRELEEAV